MFVVKYFSIGLSNKKLIVKTITNLKILIKSFNFDGISTNVLSLRYKNQEYKKANAKQGIISQAEISVNKLNNNIIIKKPPLVALKIKF